MKRTVVILFHLLYWLIYLCVLSLLYLLIVQDRPAGYGQFAYWWSLMLEFAVIPAGMGFYLFYTVLFRRFLTLEKIGNLCLAAAAVAIAATAVGELLLYATFSRFNWSSGMVIGMGMLMSLNVLLNGLAGLGLKSFVTWYGELKWKEELTRRTHETELALVRSQLHPHFLFNTINNIDVLIQKDPSRASAYLNRLSDIMRFMLYETKAERIPLEKELAYIDRYIALQQLRTANPDFVQYTLEGMPGGRSIAPMLAIPFIENAFKHAAQKREGAVITIRMLIEKDELSFECRNLYAAGALPEDGHSGLGNELIEKRLSLLYPGAYRLQITDAGGVYKVALRIPLS